jgi:hypothetical protein
VPFDVTRASVPGTTFAILQSPPYLAIGSGPVSSGQVETDLVAIDGFTLELPAQNAAGTLHYQAIFRAFGDGNRAGKELKAVGKVPLSLNGHAETRQQKFGHQLDCSDFRRFADAKFTLEVDLSWQGSPPLALVGPQRPIRPK